MKTQCIEDELELERLHDARSRMRMLKVYGEDGSKYAVLVPVGEPERKLSLWPALLIAAVFDALAVLAFIHFVL